MSEDRFAEACRVIAGGVNSPVRAFKGVGGTPLFIDHARGPFLFDSTGARYIDYVASWGAIILGHADPEVVSKVSLALQNGLSFGAPTCLETHLAERIVELMPGISKLRLVNSGTEAAMSAIRLARGFTGRDRIVKFQGGYHGHADSLLVKQGSGGLTLGVPDSAGVPGTVTQDTRVLLYNDCEMLEQVFAAEGECLAAVIVEPVAGNMNCVPARKDFLLTLRRLCDDYGVLLIFDEVMSGFRVALGGAQAHYGVQPDLCLLGKVIGGGLPIGAFGGRSVIMDQLAPDGPVYQAGTLSGNPIAVTAGLCTLERIATPGFFARLHRYTETLVAGCLERAKQRGIAMAANHIGGMFGLFFSEETRIEFFAQVMGCDQQHYRRFFHGLLEHGVYLAPSPFEAGFVSAAHGDAEQAATLEAMDKVLSVLR